MLREEERGRGRGREGEREGVREESQRAVETRQLRGRRDALFLHACFCHDALKPLVLDGRERTKKREAGAVDAEEDEGEDPT